MGRGVDEKGAGKGREEGGETVFGRENKLKKIKGMNLT